MKRRAQAGYTLIEIVVAFAILALGLTLLLGTLSGATRQVRDAGEAGRAALHAASLLAELGEHAQPGAQEGELEDGRYRWQLQVDEWTDTTLADDQAATGAPAVDPNAPRLLRLQLDLAWGGGGPRQRLAVSSLRWRQPVQAGMGLP